MSSKPKSLKKLSLDDPLQFIKGVGPKRAALLKKLQMETAADALFFLPFRYDDRSQVKKIADLFPGEMASFTGKSLMQGLFTLDAAEKFLKP